MKQLLPFAVAAVLLSACQKSVDVQSTTDPSVEANWSTTAQFGSETTADGYNFNNDVWGSGAGAQTLWVNSSSNWGVWSNQPNTGGVKSYPHAAKNVGKLINSLNSCTSSFNVTLPSTGSYEATYDI